MWLAVASGIALASACGLRAFLPLWILGLLGRTHVVPLAASMEWLAHDCALVALGVATVVEIAADKIPVVAHVLDVLGLAVRPAAAWLASYAVFHDWPTPWGQGASLALAVLALGIQVAKAKLRIGADRAARPRQPGGVRARGPGVSDHGAGGAAGAGRRAARGHRGVPRGGPGAAAGRLIVGRRPTARGTLCYPACS
jgi:hypothetical protein